MRTRGKSRENRMMSNTYTAIFERDGDWYVAHCNGSARSQRSGPHEGRSALELVLTDRREDALRFLPDEAERDTVPVVGG